MPLFGGSDESKQDEDIKFTVEVSRTGREVDVIVKSLCMRALDEDETVRDTVQTALMSISGNEPDLVVSTIVAFFLKAKGISSEHKVRLLHILASVLEAVSDKINGTLAVKVIQFLFTILCSGINAAMQTPASECLVLFASQYVSDIVDTAMGRWQPGKMPPYFVLKGLGDCAAANGVGFTPRLTEVMQRLVPTMGQIKQPAFRWCAAASLGHFAEGYSHFQANADPDSKGRLGQVDMTSTFDVLISGWLDGNKDPKVTFATVEALGYMFACMPTNSLEARAPKLVDTLLNMYRKAKLEDQSSVSRGLGLALTETVKQSGNQLLQPLLTKILTTLHPLAAAPVDYTRPYTLKNQTEILRTYEVLCRTLHSPVLNFVIMQVGQKAKETQKLGTLNILRHFVQHMDEAMEDSKSVIMSTARALAADTSPAVRSGTLKLCTSMAHKHYFSLEGSSTLVNFIVNQASLAKDEKTETKGGDHSPRALRQSATHLLGVMASKLESTHRALWPHLFEFFVSTRHNPAILTIMRCVGHLAEVKKESGAPDFMFQFNNHPDVPTPQALFTRCVVLAAKPFAGSNSMGVTIIRALIALSPLLHENLEEFLGENGQALIEHLEESDADDFNQGKWQDALLRMVKHSLAAIDDRKWVRDLVNAMDDQLALYAKDWELHKVLLRYIGTALAQVESKSLVNATLESLEKKVAHDNETSRDGFAQALGFTSNRHLDSVLPRLASMLAVKEKKGGFFGLGSEKVGPTTQVQCTAMLCYGYVVKHADAGQILSRIEVNVMGQLLPVLASAQAGSIKTSVLKSTNLIAKALQPTRLPDGKQDFILESRDKLYKGILNVMTPDSKVNGKSAPSNEHILSGLLALQLLMSLNPALGDGLKDLTLKLVLGYYRTATGIATPREKSTSVDKKQASPAKQKKKADSSAHEITEEYKEQLTTGINDILITMVRTEPTVEALCDVLDKLLPWTKSKHLAIRSLSSQTYLLLLTDFVKKLKKGETPQMATQFPSIGKYIAGMLPRCGDEDLDVRCTAVDAIQRILYIDQLLDEPSNTTPKHEVKIISDIKSKVADFGDIGEVLGDLAGLLGLTVKVGSGIDLIKQAIQNCCDSDRSSARASARVMRGLVRHHVAEIPASVPDLVEEFLTALPDVASEVQDAVSEGFKVLVGSHFEAVITRLLQESAPLSEAALQLFGCLMDSDHKTNIPEQTLRKLFTVMNETTLNEDTPTPIAQTATAAFAHLMGMEHQKSLLQELYAECMVSLLLRCGTARGADPLSEEDSVVGLQKFLRSVGHESVSDGMDKEMAWEQLSTDAFDEGVTSYARLWACEEGNSPRVLMKFLSHFYSQQSLKGQRIVAVSMIAEFVQRVEDDETLVKDLIKFLLPRTTDKVEKVRKQAIRGLGNLVKCWHLTDMSMIAGSILSGLTTASEDKNAEVASEAVRALTRLCDVIGESTMGPMLNTMCFRLRPAFDRDDASVRAAAFSLFGALTRFGRAAEFKKEFEDELHQTLMMCVCHTNDKEESVRAAAFAALKECAETLESKEMLSAMAEVDATPEQYHYDPLAKQLVAVMLSQYGDNRLRGYVDTCMTYLSSKWKDIRSASVYALAQLMAHASDSQKLKVNASTVVEAMIKLLSGKNAQVRDKTARALSLLHKY